MSKGEQERDRKKPRPKVTSGFAAGKGKPEKERKFTTAEGGAPFEEGPLFTSKKKGGLFNDSEA